MIWFSITYMYADWDINYYTVGIIQVSDVDVLIHFIWCVMSIVFVDINYWDLLHFITQQFLQITNIYKQNIKYFNLFSYFRCLS